LRIAMLAPISWRTPPRHYGPWELVTSLLTEALVARGVDVTLFATKDSRTAGKLAGVCPAPYSEDPAIDAKAWEMLHVAHVFERAGEFDLIHNQADFVPLAFSRLVETPVVTTIHGFSSPRILPIFKAYEDRVHYVAISNANRHADLRYAAMIHHGIRLEDFVFNPRGSDASGRATCAYGTRSGSLVIFVSIRTMRTTAPAHKASYGEGYTRSRARTTTPPGCPARNSSTVVATVITLRCRPSAISVTGNARSCTMCMPLASRVDAAGVMRSTGAGVTPRSDSTSPTVERNVETLCRPDTVSTTTALGRPATAPAPSALTPIMRSSANPGNRSTRISPPPRINGAVQDVRAGKMDRGQIDWRMTLPAARSSLRNSFDEAETLAVYTIA